MYKKVFYKSLFHIKGAISSFSCLYSVLPILQMYWNNISTRYPKFFYPAYSLFLRKFMNLRRYLFFAGITHILRSLQPINRGFIFGQVLDICKVGLTFHRFRAPLIVPSLPGQKYFLKKNMTSLNFLLILDQYTYLQVDFTKFIVR